MTPALGRDVIGARAGGDGRSRLHTLIRAGRGMSQGGGGGFQGKGKGLGDGLVTQRAVVMMSLRLREGAVMS